MASTTRRGSTTRKRWPRTTPTSCVQAQVSRLIAQAMRKRLISLHLHHSPLPSTSTAVAKGGASTSSGSLSLQRGVELLVEYLDTVYNDVEAWQELADVYASQGLCAHSRTSASLTFQLRAIAGLSLRPSAHPTAIALLRTPARRDGVHDGRLPARLPILPARGRAVGAVGRRAQGARGSRRSRASSGDRRQAGPSGRRNGRD